MNLQKILIAPFLGIIKIYQNYISPLTPASCRFQPTCSSYAKEAFITHGLFKGLVLSVKRIAKCHPWGASGYDPVPPKDAKHKTERNSV
ncbi:membrane protein insertion efficiency factor YidD [Mesonia sp.]|uniref:membrane protein insertion efficiency factor YidD n=1 Tax=Mesonia sp. TaxID=1960830 RepID=UPI003F989955